LATVAALAMKLLAYDVVYRRGWAKIFPGAGSPLHSGTALRRRDERDNLK